MKRVRGAVAGLLGISLGCYSGVDAGDPEAAETQAADGTGQGSASGPSSSGSAGSTASSTSTSTTTAGDGDSNDVDATGPDDGADDSVATSDAGDGDGDGSDDGDVDPMQGCSPGGAEIVAIINDVRAQHGLPAIPLSPSMCAVAATHNQDLIDHAPHAPAECNLHSWSNQGPWSGCCYTSDHAQAQCMWNKPGELTVYPGNGYEVSAAGGNLTPQGAVNLWMNSAGHRAVLLSEGAWADPPWKALGADIQGGFAAAWFGRQDDPAP